MVSLKAMAKDAKSKKKVIVPKKAPKPEQSYKSAEFIQDSDDEEDDKNSDEETEEESDSNEGSPLADTTDAVPITNGKFVAPNGSSSSSENESDSAEEDEEGNSDDEDDDETEDPKPANELVTRAEPVKKPTKEPATKTISSNTAPYKPPTGFEQSRLDGSTRASQMFQKSNLEGKQIWYFTAPASVPISSIENMSLLDVKNGSTVLSHKDGDYGFLQDSAEEKTYTKIMVPNISDEGYRTTSREIDQILHLRHIVKLPGVHEGVASSANSTSIETVPAKRPARPQPKGLKMRFRPLGFGSGKTGKIGSGSEESSDEEMEEAPPFRTPVLADSDKSSEALLNSDEEMADAPPTKPVAKTKSENPASSTPASLKRKHIEGLEKKGKNSSSSTTNTPNDKKLKRLKKKQTESQINTADKPSLSTNVLELMAPNRQRQTPVHPPKAQRSSQSSNPRNGSQPSQSSQNSDAKKRDQTSPAGRHDSPLKELTRAAK